VKAALCKKDKYYDTQNLCISAQKTISDILRTTSPTLILHELQDVHVKAYRELLNALLDTAAFWDGLVLAKRVLRKSMFPKDAELLETSDLIKSGFLQRSTELRKQNCEGDDLVTKSRQGKVFQKRYPWLEIELHWRKPALICDINANLGAGNCEIKPVVFRASKSKPEEMAKEGENLGPLGVFAKHDIKEDELVMVDECLTGVSDVPSSRLEHCDACHASLVFPFFLEMTDIQKPTCCGRVAYCGKDCFERAKDYHKILCGIDIDWIYDKICKTPPNQTRWRPIMFLRIAAIIIAERRATPKGHTPVHPLQHPIMAVMTANYSPGKLQPEYPSDWQFFENVEAPTRILLQLGVDIFTEKDWSQEVIQTMFWRMENNGNMSNFNPKLALEAHTTLANLEKPKTITSILESEIFGQNSAETVHMHSLNTQYLFLNHSCEPNISWHGSNPSLDDEIDWYKGLNGHLVKFGSSTVFCKARRDIKAGEELKISYIGDPLCVKGGISEEERKRKREAKKLWMEKWFEGGCGCNYCERENIENSLSMDNLDNLDNLERLKDVEMSNIDGIDANIQVVQGGIEAEIKIEIGAAPKCQC
jgi:hypothetical protein